MQSGGPANHQPRNGTGPRTIGSEPLDLLILGFHQERDELSDSAASPRRVQLFNFLQYADWMQEPFRGLITSRL